MRHVGLKVRMLVVGTVLFAFYSLLAMVALSMGVGLPLVLLGTLAFVGVQYVVGKKVALWSVGAEDMSEDEFPQVHRTVESLSRDMGVEKPRLMVAEMGVPNAFAVGRKGAGVVVVSRELLQVLDGAELEGVLAHELAHVRNRDVVLMVLGQSVASLVGIAVQWAVIFAGDEDMGDFIAGWLAGTLVQMIAMVFVLAISRYREYVADGDAAEAIGSGEPLARALETIHSHGQGGGRARGRGRGRGRRRGRSQGDVSDNVSALCIFGGERGLLSSLFSTHPPMEKRIERLRS